MGFVFFSLNNKEKANEVFSFRASRIVILLYSLLLDVCFENSTGRQFFSPLHYAMEDLPAVLCVDYRFTFLV